MINIADLFEKLNGKFNGQIELSESGQSIYVKREEVISFLKSLKEEYGYSKLADITSADYEDRYEVVYNLLNEKADILTAKVKLEKDNSTIPSATSIWRAASDQEREVYDLMGIGFEGHDNLTRILTQDGFEGHPLQKSFKLDRVSRF